MSAEKSSLKEVLSSIDPKDLVEAWRVFDDRLGDEPTEESIREAYDTADGMAEEYPALKDLIIDMYEHCTERGYPKHDSEFFVLGAIAFAGSLKQLADQQELRQIIGG